MLENKMKPPAHKFKHENKVPVRQQYETAETNLIRHSHSWKSWDHFCLELLCHPVTTALVWKGGTDMKRETDSWGDFYLRLLSQAQLLWKYQSTLRHTAVPLIYCTMCCQSSNGNITATLFKSHIQYLLFSQLQLERNVNKPYKPCRALILCHCAAGLNLDYVRNTQERVKPAALKSVLSHLLYSTFNNPPSLKASAIFTCSNLWYSFILFYYLYLFHPCMQYLHEH